MNISDEVDLKIFTKSMIQKESTATLLSSRGGL